MSRAEQTPISFDDVDNAIRLPVVPSNKIIYDEMHGRDLAGRDLYSQTKKLMNAPSVIVDLDDLSILDINAAFELFGMWIPDLQREREKAGKDPIRVIITAKHLDILRTVRNALIGCSDVSAWALIQGGQTGEGADELIQITREPIPTYGKVTTR